MEIPRPIVIDHEAAPFGSRWVRGRLIPTYLSHEVVCSSSEMNDILSSLPGGAENNIWLWKPSSDRTLSDENGNNGIWVLCIANRLGIYNSIGELVSKKAPVWQPYFDAVIPIAPHFPISDTDELFAWMRMTLPIYQPGKTIEERMDLAARKLSECAKRFWMEVYLKQRGEIVYMASHMKFGEAVKNSFSRCDPEERRRISKEVALKLEKRVQAIENTFAHVVGA